MVWEKRVRFLSWICFGLILVPLAVVVYSAAAETEEAPVIALALLFTFSILFAVLRVASLVIRGIEKENIKKKGIAAKATIISVSDTGTMINNQPQLSIELEVQPPYDSQFRVTVEYIVPYSALPQVQPGRTVRVFYIEETKEVALADL